MEIFFKGPVIFSASCVLTSPNISSSGWQNLIELHSKFLQLQKPSCSWLWVVFKPLRNIKSFFRRDKSPQQGALSIVTSLSLERTSSLGKLFCNSCFAHFRLQNMNLGVTLWKGASWKWGGERKEGIWRKEGFIEQKTSYICASPSHTPSSSRTGGKTPSEHTGHNHVHGKLWIILFIFIFQCIFGCRLHVSMNPSD